MRTQPYIAAYRDVQQAQRALLAGNLEDAVALSQAAARRLPESGKSTPAGELIRGLEFLATDQPAEAVVALKRARQSKWHQGATLETLLLKAEVEAAFNARDIDQYLRKSLALAAATRDDKLADAGVAAAYAWKYAANQKPTSLESAQAYLKKAESLAGSDSQEFQEYRGFIGHRLDTREVISRKEYHRRFPNGYRAGSTR